MDLLAVLAVLMVALVFSVDTVSNTTFRTSLDCVTCLILEMMFIALLGLEITMACIATVPFHKCTILLVLTYPAPTLASMGPEITVTHLTCFAKVGPF